MAPKKAVKKAAKKAAKKSAGAHDPHKAAKDARRTFEHLGRVQALAKLTSSEAGSLQSLTATADGAFRAQKYKESADLLRAAEHLSFATLHADATEAVAAELKQVIKEEFTHLLERADEHASRHVLPRETKQLFLRLVKDAKASMRRGSLRAALEYARGAEALAHVHDLDSKRLTTGPTQKRLQE